MVLHSLAALDGRVQHKYMVLIMTPFSIKATKYLRDIRHDHSNWEFEQASVFG